MRSPAIGHALQVLALVFTGSACSGGSDAASSTAGAAGAPSMSAAGSASTSAGGATSAGATSAGATSAGATSATGGTVSQSGSTSEGGGASAGSGQTGGRSGDSPTIAGCAILPNNHIFNTPIDALPAHGSTNDFMKAVGTRNIHLDLGTSVDVHSDEYYGIPYNVVHSKTITWQTGSFTTTDTELDWDPAQESDCASGTNHDLVSPCTAAAAPRPQFPIPPTPLVEGGIVTEPDQPYGDHHILLLDADSCSLWELYHAYPDPKGGWDIFGAAYFDLKSNALRPASWTSADAAGFPILPLLLRADEASAGLIPHALRFTIDSGKIRSEYTWPARHLTGKATAASLPAMGQAFRIKAGYAIPAHFNTQARAIVQALKTYGMYLADGGSSMYIQGEPSASWQEDTFSQVQSVSSAEFEAVDLGPIAARAGFDPNSAAVP
jgi:hypothetical protein